MIKFWFINGEWRFIPKIFYHHIYWYRIAWIKTYWKQTWVRDIIWINRHVVNRDEKYNRLPIWQRLSARWWLAGTPIPAQFPLTIPCKAEVSLNLFRIGACLRILQLIHLPQKMRQRRQNDFKKNNHMWYIVHSIACTSTASHSCMLLSSCDFFHLLRYLVVFGWIKKVSSPVSPSGRSNDDCLRPYCWTKACHRTNWSTAGTC